MTGSPGVDREVSGEFTSLDEHDEMTANLEEYHSENSSKKTTSLLITHRINAPERSRNIPAPILTDLRPSSDQLDNDSQPFGMIPSS